MATPSVQVKRERRHLPVVRGAHLSKISRKRQTIGLDLSLDAVPPLPLFG
jgi:hypothetical protein